LVKRIGLAAAFGLAGAAAAAVMFERV
jgi:hypothetical protein